MDNQFDAPSNGYFFRVHLHCLHYCYWEEEYITQQSFTQPMSLSDRWWRAVCAWAYKGFERKSRRNFSTLFGSVPSTAVQQLLTLLLLPFTSPGHWLPNMTMKGARRGQDISKLKELITARQAPVEGHAFVEPTCTFLPFSHMQWMNFLWQDPDVCNVDSFQLTYLFMHP